LQGWRNIKNEQRLGDETFHKASLDEACRMTIDDFLTQPICSKNIVQTTKTVLTERFSGWSISLRKIHARYRVEALRL